MKPKSLAFTLAAMLSSSLCSSAEAKTPTKGRAVHRSEPTSIGFPVAFIYPGGGAARAVDYFNITMDRQSAGQCNGKDRNEVFATGDGIESEDVFTVVWCDSRVRIISGANYTRFVSLLRAGKIYNRSTGSPIPPFLIPSSYRVSSWDEGNDLVARLAGRADQSYLAIRRQQSRDVCTDGSSAPNACDITKIIDNTNVRYGSYVKGDRPGVLYTPSGTGGYTYRTDMDVHSVSCTKTPSKLYRCKFSITTVTKGANDGSFASLIGAFGSILIPETTKSLTYDFVHSRGAWHSIKLEQSIATMIAEGRRRAATQVAQQPYQSNSDQPVVRQAPTIGCDAGYIWLCNN